ncbi:RICIN domain-containing protein [Nocardia sp. NBC_01730]|uniref:RICIN domain-containing protein n=1 Tax=Nocardia sp. NBC_01730 TaxID=2975998 RepID=UPI002E13C701|nr:RICIN domain-containing protein [Nocardia sp. NBC_01730]
MPRSRVMVLIGAIATLLLSAVAVAPTAAAQDAFPEGFFYIRNVHSGLVVDIKDGSTAEGARAIVWDRKSSDSANQLWRYDRGFLVNKNSGLVLEVVGHEGGGSIAPGTPVAQARKRERPKSLNQQWAYNREMLMPYDPDVALSARDGNFAAGTEVVVDTTQMGDPRQEWMFDTAE